MINSHISYPIHFKLIPIHDHLAYLYITVMIPRRIWCIAVIGTCIVTSPSSPQPPYFKICCSNQAVFILISLIFIQETSVFLSWPTVDRQSVVRSCYSQLPKYLLPYIIFRIISYYVLREQAGTLAPPKSDIHKVRCNCNTKALKQLSTVLEEGVVSQAAFFVSSRNATRTIA